MPGVRTGAGVDQEHLPVLMWADPRVPDRTAALLGQGPSPLPAMVEGARWLQRAGATCIAVPCNTAHAYVDHVSRAVGVEVLDMVQAALGAVGGAERVGVLAKRGTRLARLYERAGERAGVEVLQVSEDVQERCVDAAIRAVKDGGDHWRAEEMIAEAAGELRGRGAQAVIAACTEIPLVSGLAAEVLPVVDSTRPLVGAAVERLLPVRV